MLKFLQTLSYRTYQQQQNRFDFGTVTYVSCSHHELALWTSSKNYSQAPDDCICELTEKPTKPPLKESYIVLEINLKDV